MIAFTAFISQFVNPDAFYIVLGLILFALIDLGIVVLIKKRQRQKAIAQSFAKRTPSIIY